MHILGLALLLAFGVGQQVERPAIMYDDSLGVNKDGPVDIR